jgi:hypothetical protein
LGDFFEEESLSSNSDDSGDDDDDDGDDDDGEMGHPSDEIYKRYFGNASWKGSGTRGSVIRNQTSGGTGSMTHSRASLVGPSSDMLSPVVKITTSFDAAVMNGQSPLLARGWKLGSWKHLEETKSDSDGDGMPTHDANSKLHLPHYRDLVPLPKGQPFSRPRSDPNLSNSERKKKSRFDLPLDEPGVHGGIYTVRPNLEESMTFLKKLFSHQQEAGTTFNTLLSPPDSPVRKSR